MQRLDWEVLMARDTGSRKAVDEVTNRREDLLAYAHKLDKKAASLRGTA